MPSEACHVIPGKGPVCTCPVRYQYLVIGWSGRRLVGLMTQYKVRAQYPATFHPQSSFAWRGFKYAMPGEASNTLSPYEVQYTADCAAWRGVSEIPIRSVGMLDGATCLWIKRHDSSSKGAIAPGALPAVWQGRGCNCRRRHCGDLRRVALAGGERWWLRPRQ